MSVALAWPVRAAGLGPVQVGTVLWTLEGQHNVTVLVKTTFQFVPDGPMAVADAEPLQLEDQCSDAGPVGSLRAVRETAPLLQQADVVLYGHAWAPPLPSGQRQATESDVRLAVVREGQPVLDKTLLIYGDRKAEGEPAPFERMPIAYERALGGIGIADNPLGKGQGASTDALPNIVDPADPTGTVGCLGPIPATFPARRQLLRGESRKAVEGLRLDIPRGFDWSYFQCAPVDQRIDSLKGDEWLQLDGLTEELRLCTRLPGSRGVARIYGAERAGVPDAVPLVADLVQIDADRRRCSLVWRGSFPIHDQAAAQQLLVVGAYQSAGETVQWPRSVEEVPQSVFQQPSAGSTTLDESEAASARDRDAAESGAAPDLFATVALDVESPAGPATPFDEQPRAAGTRCDAAAPSGQDGPMRPATAFDCPLQPTAGAAAAPTPEDGETRVLSDDELAAAQGDKDSPFALAAPGPTQSGAEPAPEAPPGAPWSKQPAPEVPQADRALFETLPLDGAVLAAGTKGPAASRTASKQEQQREAAEPAQAEQQAQQGAEQQREAERQAEAEAKRKAQAKAEAKARRKAEAEKLAAEQQRAEAAEAKHEAEELRQKRRASKTLSQKIFGGFRRKR